MANDNKLDEEQQLGAIAARKSKLTTHHARKRAKRGKGDNEGAASYLEMTPSMGQHQLASRSLLLFTSTSSKLLVDSPL